MKEFIEKTLHQKVEIIPYKEIKKFPLVLRVDCQVELTMFFVES